MLQDHVPQQQKNRSRLVFRRITAAGYLGEVVCGVRDMQHVS